MSNIVEKIFSASTLKFLAALSIPCGLAYFWYYSNEQARIEVESYQKEMKENPLSDQVEVKNYQLKEVDDTNQVRWQLLADKGTMQPSSKEVILTKIRVDYFDGKILKMRLTAPLGMANESTRKIRLDAEKGERVVAEGEGGKSRMSAVKVELTKKNQFVATGGVNIDMPGVAKVTGNSATGVIGKAGIQDFKIVGNTHSIVQM
ncbi:MAG: hypothetical protein IAF58_17600 [Leptolyngbya sp.]|nr:hypothetical protein [Candidatus Melainabacteria bacterium]